MPNKPRNDKIFEVKDNQYYLNKDESNCMFLVSSM